MSASIVDVARAAGVSHSTVSRVLNNRPGVSTDAAERVLHAIRAVGYSHKERRPGRKPREFRQVGTLTIGLVMAGVDVDFSESPVAASVFHAIEMELTERGYDLVVCRVGASRKLPPAIERSGTDGLLLYGRPPPPEISKLLRLRPSVWLLSERGGSGYWGDRVGPDNQAIGVAAAEYLSGLGHRRVAMVRLAGPHGGFGLRSSAFVEAADALGMEVMSVESRDDDADAIADVLLNSENRPAGLFIPRDRLTAQVVRSLATRDRGYSQLVDIISCDNDTVLDALERRPATMDIRPDLIGKRAVEQILRRVERPAEGTRSLLTVEPRLVPAGGS